MNLNIEYEKALDFEHLNDLQKAGEKLSELTTILNRVLIIRQRAKMEIIEACSSFPEAQTHKLSWDNKLVKISELLGSSKKSNLWQEADIAYRMVRNKQAQVYEDINRLKKMADITPH